MLYVYTPVRDPASLEIEGGWWFPVAKRWKKWDVLM